MSAVCFVDTETTGLDPTHQIWEVGLIDREGIEHEWQLPVDLGRADPIALNIGRFHERRWRDATPQYRPFPGYVDSQPNPAGKFVLHPERLGEWCSAFVKATRGLHMVGAVVSFDAERLWRLLRANGECPMWHYHLIDVEAMAAGWVAARCMDAHPNGGKDTLRVERPDGTVNHIDGRPPWKSEDLSRAVGVDPEQFDRHTALGDARWAKAIYEAVLS